MLADSYAQHFCLIRVEHFKPVSPEIDLVARRRNFPAGVAKQTGKSRDGLRGAFAELNAEQNKVVLEVANTGANFGRVLETQLLYSKKKQEAPGFPIFPHSKRILEVPLNAKVEGENLPVTVLLTFQNFKVEEKLQRAPAVAAATKPTTEGTESRRGNP